MPRGDGETLCFELDQFNGVTQARSTMWLKLYLEDGTIEIREPERIFLKRINYAGLSVQSLLLGSTITVFNKVMTVRSYSNAATQRYMRAREVRFLCVVRQGGVFSLPPLIDAGARLGLRVGRVKTAWRAVEDAAISAGDIIVELVGMSQSSAALIESVLTDERLASLSCIQLTLSDFDTISAVLDRQIAPSASAHCSLCIVKPHVFASTCSLAALLSDVLDAGFSLASLATVHLSPAMAEELFEAYKEVAPKYGDMLAHAASGPCLALMVRGFDERTVQELRTLCGPFLPSVASTLRPASLRAKYGQSSALNAVHCSDLSEFGAPECAFIFETCAKLGM